MDITPIPHLNNNTLYAKFTRYIENIEQLKKIITRIHFKKSEKYLLICLN